MFRRVIDIMMLMVMTAFSAGWMRDTVQDFRAFQAANPGSDFWAYLAAQGWPGLIGVLVGIGVIALAIWWNREPTGGESEESSATVSARPPIHARLLAVVAIATGVWSGLQDWPDGILAIAAAVIFLLGWLIGPDPADGSNTPQKLGSR